MTVEQFIADLDELVQAVCERVGVKQVVIFGHSWGSALGVLYAARFAEKVSAYVGSRRVGVVRVRARRGGTSQPTTLIASWRRRPEGMDALGGQEPTSSTPAR
jgi:pimeloyl-ACP methyl ester carboxylesterase